MAQDDRIGLTIRSTASHWRPSKLAHASGQSSLKWDRTGLAMRFQSIFTSTELAYRLSKLAAHEQTGLLIGTVPDSPCEPFS